MPWTIFDDIAELDPARQKELRQECRRAGLSEAACVGVEEGARLILNFEKNQRSNLLTPAKRQKQFREIADLSKKLHELLDSLPLHYKESLNAQFETELIRLGIRRKSEVRGGIAADSTRWTVQTTHCLFLLTPASEALSQREAARKKKGGRASKTADRFLHLEWIWEAIRKPGATQGRPAPFGRICAAAYLAAELESGYEDDVKAFIAARDDQAVLHARYIAARADPE